MNEWISVKDRLPKGRTTVLVYFGDRIFEVAFFDDDGFWWDNDGLPFDHIHELPTHWMPLPAAPEDIDADKGNA